jgi:hypothetical protein
VASSASKLSKPRALLDEALDRLLDEKFELATELLEDESLEISDELLLLDDEREDLGALDATEDEEVDETWLDDDMLDREVCEDSLERTLDTDDTGSLEAGEPPSEDEPPPQLARISVKLNSEVRKYFWRFIVCLHLND